MEQEYYEKGVDAGKKKALNSSLQAQPHFPDLLLEQKYRQGFREGWDKARQDTQ